MLLRALLLTATLVSTLSIGPTPAAALTQETLRNFALNEIDRLFAATAAEQNLPGLVYGIMLDGRLVHSAALGLADVAQKTPVTTDTRFRIASMTKSFTALAIYRLRDAGRLALTDPLTQHLPDFRAIALPTTDSAPITLLQLLTMTAGLPQDDPWGDRQLAITPAAFETFIRVGLSFSSPPGTAYEYSNLGYALLGAVIARVTGEPYQTYITRELLAPLGMNDTVWDYPAVPPGKLALGYRWEDNAWQPEPLLRDGAYGAMGGLITTLADFARYTAFHLSAYPPRDDADSGPVRRATLREFHQPAIVAAVADARPASGTPRANATAYAHGLRWNSDTAGLVNLGHSGGLPGYGSNFRFYPALNLAIISFANRTYAPMANANAKAVALLLEKAALPARATPPDDILLTRQRALIALIESGWDSALSAAVLAENFYLDRSRESWIAHTRTTLAAAGRLTATGPMIPENALRGTFTLTGETGLIDVFFTLTPEATPKIQHVRLTPRTP
ncbi:MAG: serine hydrolase [Opitutia bacterium]|nr:class A beta-lactamase-related serine hydrolase [Opitutaceae bacterium]PHX86633.1 MAG: serine hydrolase [Opitutae bacterium]